MTAIIRTAPGSSIVRPAAGSGGSPVVRTLVPGSVTTADLAEERATEIARANGAYPPAGVVDY